MNYTNKTSLRYKVITRLLICVLFVQVLFPLQIHMHHDSDTAAHGHHVVDYHNKVVGDINELDEEYTHSLEITSNFIAKKSLNDFQFALLFTLVFFGLISISPFYQRRTRSASVLHRNYFQLSPPLRAPPL